MTPADFIRKWGDSSLRERQGAQSHFIDLCRLLGEPTPTDDDQTGDRYAFERGAEKVGGGDGWADVWRKGCFGWEYKGKHKNLDAALRQLQAYALDLENPPYLVVCDMERIIVHTNWTNTVCRRIDFSLEDLREPARLDELRQVFQGSERLKPGISPQELTAKVAVRFGALGRRLQDRGEDPRAVAHFLNRLVFCMFAEDAALLPKGLFTRVLKSTQFRPDHAKRQLEELFAKMAAGGFFGADVIRWFNGGLFDDAGALLLEKTDLKEILDTASEHDWSQIDPAVFGTLFEEALKATRKRAALGAHYTDREKILKIVEPVIVRPLMAEWETTLAGIRDALDAAAAAEADRKTAAEALAEEILHRATNGGATGRRGGGAKDLSDRTAAPLKARNAAFALARERLETFLVRLGAFRVLDPACGSGNFLYVALHALRDIELRAIVEADRLGVPDVPSPRVGLDCLRGIEIEPYAAELARVTLWIGDLQWLRKNGFVAYAEPILSALEQIECRDALLNADGTEAEWPEADVIVGNPPFVGDKKMIAEIGEDKVESLRRAYEGLVPGGADFVVYWVYKAWAYVASGLNRRAGFVATNSVRGGSNRRIIAQISDADAIWEAWADEPWVLKGAAVRVSMIGFGEGFIERRLNGNPALVINSDLTGTSTDTAKSNRLNESDGISFIGTQKNGAFDVPGSIARDWLRVKGNPNSKPNSLVLKPWMNGQHLTRRSDDMWIIYFSPEMVENEAALFEAPFEHALRLVAPMRTNVRRENHRVKWWIHGEPRPGMIKALSKIDKFIGTPRVSKHRVFKYIDTRIIPDCQIVAIARDDDTAFGILHSRFHELWSLRMGTSLEDRPRYTPSTTFETFPFPDGLTPNIPAADYAADPRAIAIAEAAADLDAKREAWLNPADLVRIEPEVVPGYPDRILPVDEAAAKVLKTRTLTNLYNQRPAWLDMAHRRLDAAVAAAYGWPDDLSDDAILERLFALNQERAAAGR